VKLAFDSKGHLQFYDGMRIHLSVTRAFSNKSLPTDPEKLTGASVPKGMDLHCSLASNRHTQRHALDFIMRWIQSKKFYPNVRQGHLG
jgi:hypothetical protein